MNLALAMGVTVTDDPTTLPAAKDPFPAARSEALPSDAEIRTLVASAPAQREDLKASVAHAESGAILAKGAKLDTRPRLDLTGRTWLTGLGEINASNALDRWVGPSVSASLGIEIPLGNNFYRGRSLQREADLRQRQISAAELERQIKLNVVRNGGTLREAAARVQQAQDAVGFYRKTIEAEMERFQAGDSTLVDTILTEEQSTEALITLVAAQADYAHLVAQLRYETGLLAPDGGRRHPRQPRGRAARSPPVKRPAGVCLLAAAVALVASTAGAQQVPAGAAPAPQPGLKVAIPLHTPDTAASVASAPKLQAPAISLPMAVQLTVMHDPRVQGEMQQVAFSSGQLQQASGRFDQFVSATPSYSRSLSELTDYFKDREAGKRELLDAARRRSSRGRARPYRSSSPRTT